MHLTWSQAAYDPFNPLSDPLPTEPILPTLPGRPLVYQVAKCWDCDWNAVAKTYAEIVDAREAHAYQGVGMAVGVLPAAPVPVLTRDVSEDVAA